MKQHLKLLLVGGTGIISAAVSRIALEQGHELWLINRGNNNDCLPEGAHIIKADINDVETVSKQLEGHTFDCVANFIVQRPEQIDRDYKLFCGKTKQYIFISSGSVYQKPLNHYEITESTPAYNPYWAYPRNKIACEMRLTEYYRNNGFPMTIVRPGHTYNETWLPLCISGYYDSYAVIKRIMEGKPTIIPGDGSSLWTVTHNTDFARAFLGITGNPYAIGETINITSDEVLTWNQIYETIADALGVKLNPFYVSSMFLHNAGPYDMKCCLIGERTQSTVFKNDKLKRLVPGFRAEVPFRVGIRHSLEYIKAHPECHIEDPIFDGWCDRLAEGLTKLAKEIRVEFPNYV